MGSDADTRLEELECRVALQDESIETLSDQLYQQQKQLEKLQHEFGLVKDWIKQTLSASSPQVGSEVDEKPPHY